MDNQLDNKMEKFLEEAQCTLNTLKKTVNWFKYLASGIIALMLTFVIDTRIEVVKKADAEELNYIIKDVDRMFLTKKDATLIHSLEYQYYIRKSKDSTISYPEQIKVILNSN